MLSFFFKVTQFVSGLFDSKEDLPGFKDHIRDFLVQSKEFSAQVRRNDGFLNFVHVLM